jgi:uncharacterized membrane protein
MSEVRRLEDWLAALLRGGTWLASAVIGLGFTLAFIDSRFGTHNLAILPNAQIVNLGIALLILLPPLRVLVMLFAFIRERDFRLAFIAAVVLTMILLGVVAGFAVKQGIAG